MMMERLDSISILSMTTITNLKACQVFVTNERRCRNLKIRGTVFTVSVVISHIGESSKIISVSCSS